MALTQKQTLKAADTIAKEFGASSAFIRKEAADFDEKLFQVFQKTFSL